jgi:PPK2 family polyphosphate:nucleotide phosphotransferase
MIFPNCAKVQALKGKSVHSSIHFFNKEMKEDYVIKAPSKNFDIASFDTEVKMGKEECKAILKENLVLLNDLQEKLYSSDKQGVVLVFQAMDAAGKDSTIRAVFSGMNPQGFKVTSFKQPSKEELSHDYLWRVNKAHYEEVLVTRVHPEYILYQDIPGMDSVDQVDDKFWAMRFEQINNYERYLVQNGYLILKFFLNVSLAEQKKRFLSRMENADKNWKFSLGDMKERQLWDKYMHAYSEAIGHTAQPHAPWHVIPADDKDYIRASVSTYVLKALQGLNLTYPAADDDIASDIKEAYSMFAEE